METFLFGNKNSLHLKNVLGLMQSYNDLSLNYSVLDKMLITPWNFNYHNDGNTWIFSSVS